jgi:hypothetical protein
VRRSRLAKLAVPVAVAALAGLTAPSALAASPKCEDKVGDTLARNATTRVFQRITGKVGDRRSIRLYSCRIRTTAAIQFYAYHDDLDGVIRVTGVSLPSTKYAVVKVDEETGTNDSIALWEFDVTKPYTDSSPDARSFTYSRDGLDATDTQVVATRHGGVALLDGGVLTLWDATGQRTLAASGASDLAWAAGGDRIYWTAAGLPTSTTTSGRPSGDFPAS